MNMKRFVPYLGIVAVLAAVLFIATLPSVSVVEQSSPTATTTPVVVATSSTPAPLVPAVASSSPTKASATLSAEKPSPKVSTSVSAPVQPVLAPMSPAPTAAELDAAASTLRAALVNIICYAPTGSGLRSTSGSGIIVDPKGIILTNAHIADRFLLADRGVSCIIRAGSPAIDRYRAALIYISPVWLRTNPDILTKTNPIGTGEADFAFLAVTKSANSVALPTSFPYISLATLPPFVGTPIVIASYGAQFLEASQIQFALFPTIVFGSVKDVFTFASTTIDVLALGGSAAAQEGSSGGGVAGASGTLVGTITTSTVKGTTDTRALDAITASYIRAEYASETGEALDLLLAEPTAAAVATFAPQIPALEALITAQLP